MKKTYLIILATLSFLNSSAQLVTFFEEDFTNNTIGWPITNYSFEQQYFKDGFYHINKKSSGALITQIEFGRVYIEQKKDFAIETEITSLEMSEKDNSYWIGYGDLLNNSVGFVIYSDGRFKFGMFNEDKWIESFPPEYSDAINKGSGDNISNKIRVEKKGTNLILSINDKIVKQIPYINYKTGSQSHISINLNKKGYIKVNYIKILRALDSQQTLNEKVENLYPFFKSLSKEKPYYYGCVSGNCIEGKGTYLMVTTRVNDGQRVDYDIYDGEFYNNGSSFKGSNYFRGIPANENKKGYTPANKDTKEIAQFKTNLKPETVGEFEIVSNFTSEGLNYLTFYKNGKFDDNRIYNGGNVLYVENKFLIESQYYGLVDEDGNPTIGKTVYQNGNTYEGCYINNLYEGFGRLTSNGKIQEGIFSEGKFIKPQKIYIPTNETLQKAALDYGKNQAFNLNLNTILFESNTWRKLMGKLYNDKGEQVDKIENGIGFLYGGMSFFYLGSFKSNEFNGLGNAYYDYFDNKDITANYYIGDFNSSVFNKGTFNHKFKSWSHAIKSTTDDLKYDSNLKTAYDLISANKFEEGIKWLETQSASGNEEATAMLGQHYYYGNEVSKDIKKAYQLFEIAAKKGSPLACYYLCLAHYKAKDGFQKNNSLALEFIQKGWDKLKLQNTFSVVRNRLFNSYFMDLKYPQLTYEEQVKYSPLDEIKPEFQTLVKTRKAEAQATAYVQQQLEEQNKFFEIELRSIKGNYYYNNQNKCIYQVDANAGLFQGNLVKMRAVHDTEKDFEEYDYLNNILNTSNYKRIQFFGRCGVCYGRGYISNTYKTTEADYEYTYGVKIIKSTTKTNSCNQCGGCGLIPK
jgi:hypothetical protein